MVILTKRGIYRRNGIVLTIFFRKKEDGEFSPNTLVRCGNCFYAKKVIFPIVIKIFCSGHFLILNNSVSSYTVCTFSRVNQRLLYFPKKIMRFFSVNQGTVTQRECLLCVNVWCRGYTFLDNKLYYSELDLIVYSRFGVILESSLLSSLHVIYI